MGTQGHHSGRLSGGHYVGHQRLGQFDGDDFLAGYLQAAQKGCNGPADGLDGTHGLFSCTGYRRNPCSPCGPIRRHFHVFSEGNYLCFDADYFCHHCGYSLEEGQLCQCSVRPDWRAYHSACPGLCGLPGRMGIPLVLSGVCRRSPDDSWDDHRCIKHLPYSDCPKRIVYMEGILYHGYQ